MKDFFLILLVGFLFGLACGLYRLPIPAPPSWTGVCGIVGVVAGWKLALFILGRFQG